MVIKQQRWKHDTCNCQYIENYNTDTDTFSLNQFEVICTPHSTISDNTTRYNVLHSDNQRKNFVLTDCINQFSSILGQTDTDSGTIVLKKGITFNFSYSGSGDTRILTISFSGVSLTTQQKTTLQNLINTKYGSGKVVVQ